MQKQTLFIVGIISVILLGSCTAFFASTDTKTNTSVVLAPNHTGVETDTAKRLETYGNSETNWGMSPFGSGKPLEEASTHTGAFKKPNTEWKDRTVTLKDGRVVTYRFGEGNPEDADPLSTGEIDAYKNCRFDDEFMQDSCGNLGNEVFGYITPDVEKQLLQLIADRNWEAVLKNCSSDFFTQQADITLIEDEPRYDRILSGEYLNIDNLLVINPTTGRKELSNEVSLLRSWFVRALRGDSITNTPKDILSIHNCITQNGGMEIYKNFDIVFQKYLRPF